MERELSTRVLFQVVERKVREIFRVKRQVPIRSRFDLTDVLQEVNIQIVNRLADGTEKNQCLDTSWLSVVATGHFCKLQRLNLAKKRTVANEESSNLDTHRGGSSVVDEVEKKELAELMLNCLETMQAELRHVVIRRQFDNASYREIAEELGVSEYGIKTMYNEGLAILENCLTLDCDQHD